MNTKKIRFLHAILVGMLATTMLSSPLLTAKANDRISPNIAAPLLISPADGAETTGNPSDPIPGRVLYEPLGIPTFEWEDLGASKYELEVASTAAFGSSVIFRLSNLEYPMYTPNGEGEIGSGFSLTESSGEFIDTATFYWHVRAWDSGTNTWGNWSNVRSFTRHWGSQVQLSYPADGSVQTQTPYFEWESVPGASFYQIQVDTSNSFGSPVVNTTTDMPFFTLRDSLENDTDLFWRVRAFHRPNAGSVTGGRGGPWSEVWEFQLAWSSQISLSEDNRPLQITPPDNANYIGYPLFCWKPVVGAQKYLVELATDPQFSNFVFRVNTENDCYIFPRNGSYTLFNDTTYYWRVTALDGRNYPGQSTDSSGSGAFQFHTAGAGALQVPAHLYPMPYYTPVLYDSQAIDTFNDRTVSSPTFVWDHVDGATSYELRIDDDIALTDPPVALVTTENASYTFTDNGTYPLNDGQVYYWRVRALGTPQGTPDWDQMLNYWPVRIDRSQIETASSLQLLQPTWQAEPWMPTSDPNAKYGQESVTYYPSFSWTAVAPIGQAEYQIQIAYDSNFTRIVHDATTDFTEYTPANRPEPGTYFWRVRPVGGSWSAPGRFIVSRNFTYANSITVDGSDADWIDAGVPRYDDDSGDGAPAAYDLQGFYITDDGVDWYFGVPLPAGAVLGLYLDVDHFDTSGAVQPPSSAYGDPDWPDAHRPEYAIYVSDTDTDGKVYEWNGSAWTYRGRLFNISGEAAYASGFMEIRLPVTQVDEPGSLSVMMVSMNSSGAVQDRLPNIPGYASESAFLTESTTPTPLYPANLPANGAPGIVYHTTPILTWRHNNAADTTYYFQTFEDNTLTTIYDNETGFEPNSSYNIWASSNTFWSPQIYYSDNNSYHWRVSRQSVPGTDPDYEYSAPQHFQVASYLPTDLHFTPLIVSGTLTYTNRTPSFFWQPTQSSPRYTWELWENGVRIKNVTTMFPYYTSPDAIKDGTYTWKVYARDPRGRNSAEAAQAEFRKVSDVVPVNDVEYAPNKLVFSWDPVDFAAYYKIEIADDPQFSQIWSAITYNTTFTPKTVPQQIEDGVFYWRVFMYDNHNNAGPYINLKFETESNKIYLPLVVR